MSRLDTRYLKSMQCATWKEAFRKAATALSVTPASLKNLRDEFDPLHDNPRRGWHARPLRANRQRVLAELCEVTDSALIALAERILARDDSAVGEAIDSLASPSRIVHNVAERLATGRLAEEFFLAHTREIVGIDARDILDCRQSGRGYDFGVRGNDVRVIEVKGLKAKRGQILFTDREWAEARIRTVEYWLVVVGNLTHRPKPRVIPDPTEALTATCRYQRTVSAVWTSTIDVTAS